MQLSRSFLNVHVAVPVAMKSQCGPGTIAASCIAGQEDILVLLQPFTSINVQNALRIRPIAGDGE